MVVGLQTVFWFLVALTILVTIHEFGHFYVARRCGVKVLRFSIGFGKPLYSWWSPSGTEFCIAPIPIGGYVKMLDAREGDVPAADMPYEFTNKKLWQRMAILFAGPIANLILAVLLYWIILIPSSLQPIPFVGKVEPGSIAAAAGLREGQEIIAIDGVATPTQRDVVRRLVERIGETGEITFTVKYTDSDLQYTSAANIDNWLRGEKQPDLLGGLGLRFYDPPEVIVGRVVEGSPAEQSGFQLNDRILFADDVAVEDWQYWVNYISERPDQTIRVELIREGEELQIDVTPKKIIDDSGLERAQIGMGLKVDDKYLRNYQYSLPGAFVEAVGETWDNCALVVMSVKKLLTGELSVKSLNGHIKIAQVARSHAEAGPITFVAFLAFFSVSLGVFNLFPIPPLDGGHILYFSIEALKGSPLSERVQLFGFQVGLVLVVGVMLLALYNDVT
ncbi:sigma E protease regulator RseP [Aurantivibrio infirmus]